MAAAALTDKLGELHAVIGRDHLGRLLTDHDRRRVGVPAGYVGHDARVGHAQLT
jgi:hypothetical protein